MREDSKCRITCQFEVPCTFRRSSDGRCLALQVTINKKGVCGTALIMKDSKGGKTGTIKKP
jgi:hypothetical protein